MKICISCVGIRQPDWATEAIDDFLKRFPKDFPVAIRAVKPEARGSKTTQRIMQAEASRLTEAAIKGSYFIAMDERGVEMTSEAFARFLGEKHDAGENLTFFIGGPDGLDPDLKRRAGRLLRLSSMTLPHALARLMLVEQIYRGWSILNHHPYHRA